MLERIKRLEERVMVLEKIVEESKTDGITCDAFAQMFGRGYRQIKPRLDYEIDGEERGD